MIRIRPQSSPGESVKRLIQDPWKTFDCDTSNTSGCTFEFDDPDFARSGRDAVYYVRAMQEPQPAINAGGLRCERNDQNECISVNACYGDDRTALDDDCLADAEARAWSSPIFIDYLLSEHSGN